MYGLAVDQVLEWEVVDGNGEYRIANRQNNTDLFWALSGGGGGTYAVVLSMTSKAYADIPVSGANITFTADGVSQDTFYEAVGAWHAALPSIVDAGAVAVWTFTNTSFAVSPVTAPGLSAAQLSALLQPYFDTLARLGVSQTSFVGEFEGFYAQYGAMQGPFLVGTTQYGGWLVPRSVVQSNNDALTAAYRNITGEGARFVGFGMNVARPAGGVPVDNAVLPAWREALISSLIAT